MSIRFRSKYLPTQHVSQFCDCIAEMETLSDFSPHLGHNPPPRANGTIRDGEDLDGLLFGSGDQNRIRQDS